MVESPPGNRGGLSRGKRSKSWRLCSLRFSGARVADAGCRVCRAGAAVRSTHHLAVRFGGECGAWDCLGAGGKPRLAFSSDLQSSLGGQARPREGRNTVPCSSWLSGRCASECPCPDGYSGMVDKWLLWPPRRSASRSVGSEKYGTASDKFGT